MRILSVSKIQRICNKRDDDERSGKVTCRPYMKDLDCCVCCYLSLQSDRRGTQEKLNCGRCIFHKHLFLWKTDFICFCSAWRRPVVCGVCPVRWHAFGRTFKAWTAKP